MNNKQQLKIVLYKTPANNEPVGKWIDSLNDNDRLIVAKDIKTVQIAYPAGMPLTRPLKGYKPLEEVRSSLSTNKIARIIFYVENNRMFLLHAFIKKSQSTPKKELNTAFKRYKILIKSDLVD